MAGVASVKSRCGQWLVASGLSQMLLLGEVRSSGKGACPAGAHQRRGPCIWREKQLRGRLGEMRGGGQGLGPGRRVPQTTCWVLGAPDPESAQALEPLSGQESQSGITYKSRWEGAGGGQEWRWPAGQGPRVPPGRAWSCQVGLIKGLTLQGVVTLQESLALPAGLGHTQLLPPFSSATTAPVCCPLIPNGVATVLIPIFR